MGQMKGCSVGGDRQGRGGCCFLPLVWGRLRELRFCTRAAARPVSAPSLLTIKKRSRVPPQLARRPGREGGRGGAAGGPESGGGGRLGVEPGAGGGGRTGNGRRRGSRAEAPGSRCAGVAQVQTRAGADTVGCCSGRRALIFLRAFQLVSGRSCSGPAVPARGVRGGRGSPLGSVGAAGFWGRSSPRPWRGREPATRARPRWPLRPTSVPRWACAPVGKRGPPRGPESPGQVPLGQVPGSGWKGPGRSRSLRTGLPSVSARSLSKALGERHRPISKAREPGGGGVLARVYVKGV